MHTCTRTEPEEVFAQKEDEIDDSKGGGAHHDIVGSKGLLDEYLPLLPGTRRQHAMKEAGHMDMVGGAHRPRGRGT